MSAPSLQPPITLPSGATLQVQLAPFAESRALFSAVLEELKVLRVNLDAEEEIDFNFVKDLFCAGFCSPKIDQALKPCMSRALYNGLKISADTFEPEEARQDYIRVVTEVAKENLLPFMKSLSVRLSPILETIGRDLKSGSKMTHS